MGGISSGNSGLAAAGFNTNGNAGTIGKSSLGNNMAINPTPGFTETSGSSTFLNLYYAGSGTAATAGSPNSAPSTTLGFYGNQRMTVYAPHANVLIGSGNGVTNFYGAVVGNWVTTQGPVVATNNNYTAVHYDVQLKPGGQFINPNYRSWYGNYPSRRCRL